MSFIGNIDNIPVFTTIQDALDWGSRYNIRGYHTHVISGQIGYMAGNSHADILASNVNFNNISNTRTNQTTRYRSTSSSSSGY